MPKKEKKVELVEEKRAAVNDLFDVHDFDVHIDVDVPVDGNVLTSGSTPGEPRDVAPRRSLNLEDYKKRRGLI